jgi:uncharacterized protein (TIGR02246 family)
MRSLVLNTKEGTMPARTPDEVDTMFESAMNAGDLDGLVALYVPNATLIVGPGQEATGTEAIRIGLKAFLDQKPQMDLKVEQTIRGGEDLAVCYGVWTMMAGREKITGKSIEIVRCQQDGTWLFAIDDPRGRGG